MRTFALFIIIVILSFSSLSGLHASSAIYQYIDQDGDITFTNRPIKNEQKHQAASQSTTQHNTASLARQSFSEKNTVPQHVRDIKRRKILEHELATEIKQFTVTRHSLHLLHNKTEQQMQQRIMKRLQNKMQRHARNISAIKKELAKF